ncbi:MAG: DMT family transporter [Chloroflexi bacterium]|nr:DMT family transporter [Chloroflexota bacterium]MCH9038005.1 DMT family transporter [Chloroflexota bacterium]MCI0790790.1 DMT family transporter [Chloroflexota bacterium]
MNVVLQSLLLGVLAALGWGIADFVAAVVSKRLGILRTIVGVHLVSIPVAAVYFFAVSDISIVSLTHWAVLLLISAVSFIVYIVFYKALQVGPVAVVSPIVSAYAVVVIVLAFIFTGERLSVMQGVAVSASVGGIVLASVSLRSGMRLREVVGFGALLGFVAMVGIGVWQFGVGILSRDIGWFLPIFLGRVITFGMFVPLVAVRREWPWQRLSAPLLVGVVVVGITETGGLFAFARGAEIGVISIVAAASITYPIIPILGGLIVFKEELGFTQYVGLAVALAALLVLALSS